MKRTKNSTARFTFLALFTAIILLQTFVPGLGYIPIPPLNPTLIQMTVIVGSIVLGPKSGLLLGLIWGVLSWIRSFTSPNIVNLYIFTNPLISVVPRAAVGLLSGWLYRLLRGRTTPTFARAVTGFIGSLTNTVLVMGLIYFFFGDVYAELMNIDFSMIGRALMVVIATNGVGEAIASAFIVPLIAKALEKFERQMNPLN